MISSKTCLLLASLAGASGVAFGAYAAHGLAEPQAEWMTVGARYHLLHAVVLLCCGIWLRIMPLKAVSYAALLFCVGILLGCIP